MGPRPDSWQPRLGKGQEGTAAGKDRLDEGARMQKWQCKACPYVYDPELGDPDSGIPAGRPSRTYPMIGCARIASSARTSSSRSTSGGGVEKPGGDGQR
jgi:rubredoxin